MWEWIFTGCVFNMIYFGFGLDKFVMKFAEMNVKDVEENYSHVLDEETEQKLNRLKQECEQYKHQEERISPLSMAFDLLIFPLYIGVLTFAFVDYLVLKNKDKE